MRTIKSCSDSKLKTYQELSSLKTFEERFHYLKLGGKVGTETFGFDRYMNQRFYQSDRWKRLRDQIIIRDNGCDLGVDDRPIQGRVLIHHLNPVSQQDILQQSELLLNPDYLICVSHDTHNAIHYGDEGLLITMPPERRRNDTCPWKQ